MTVAIFDPEARKEFLSAIQYYEDCRVGLGLRFRHIANRRTMAFSRCI